MDLGGEDEGSGPSGEVRERRDGRASGRVVGFEKGLEAGHTDNRVLSTLYICSTNHGEGDSTGFSAFS